MPFVETHGTISIGTGDSVVVGSGTMFGGKNRDSSRIVARVGGERIEIGIVAPVTPPGIYDNDELPLVSPYDGAPISNAEYELIDGPAIVTGAVQAAAFSNFNTRLVNNMGLVGSLSDTPSPETDPTVPSNSLMIDEATRVIKRLRNGVVETVYTVGLAFIPMGEYDDEVEYPRNALVTDGPNAFVSNHDENLGNDPDGTPGSDEHWTWLPLPSGQGDLFDASVFAPGRPNPGRTILRHDFSTSVTFPAGLTGSHSSAGDEATAEAIFLLRRNGVQFGTITFAAASAIGVLAAPAPVTFTAGDVLTIIAPNPRDETLFDISITLYGDRT